MLVPAAFILTYRWLIWTQTPTAPYWDEWIYVPLVKHANQGTLSLQEIWALHWFSHRIVIPRLVDLALIQLTSLNRHIMMTFDLGVGVASATLILVAPMSLLLFSFSQAHDWLAPFQIAFIATAFGVACCTRALLHRPLTWSRFAFALCGALIATLSSAAGLVAWVAFAPSILRAGYASCSFGAAWRSSSALRTSSGTHTCTLRRRARAYPRLCWPISAHRWVRPASCGRKSSALSASREWALPCIFTGGATVSCLQLPHGLISHSLR
jgi:hypothetical protein